jgi:hypothetical protein
MDRVCHSIPSMKAAASTVHSHIAAEHIAEEHIQLSTHLMSRDVPKLAKKPQFEVGCVTHHFNPPTIVFYTRFTGRMLS